MTQSSNVERWKRTHTVNRYQTSSFFKPEKGEQAIRILSWMHKVTEGDVKLGRYDPTLPEEQVGRTLVEFYLPFRRHFQPKAATCGLIKRLDGNLVGECSVCDQAADFRKMKGKENAEAARKWEASIANTLQIVPLDRTPFKVITWDAPQSVIDFILEKMESRKYQGEEFFGLKNGLDLLVNYNPDSKDRKKVYGFDWNDRTRGAGDITEQTEGEAVDLHVDAKYVPEAFAGYLPPQDEADTKGVDRTSGAGVKGDDRTKAATTRVRAPEPEPKPEPKAEPAPEPKKRRVREPKPEPAPEPKKKLEHPYPAGTSVTFTDSETGKTYEGKIKDIGADGWYGIECELGVVDVEPAEVTAK